MLKKPASRRRPLFGLFGLSRLFGKPDRPDEPDKQNNQFEHPVGSAALDRYSMQDARAEYQSGSGACPTRSELDASIPFR